MSSKLLPVIRSNAKLEARSWLSLMTQDGVTLDQALALCQGYRRIGVTSLFLDGVPGLLHQNLQKSGAGFLHFLKKAKDEDKVTSKADPFFDAIACQDISTAREIAEYSRHTWNQQEEYEDDFLYVLFLMHKFFLETVDQELAELLSQYKAVVSGEEDCRLDLCRSLLDNNIESFEEALATLLIQREAYYQHGLDCDDILEEQWATDGQLCIEGLALIRLARRQGLKTQGNYLFVPSLALAETSVRCDSASWMNVE